MRTADVAVEIQAAVFAHEGFEASAAASAVALAKAMRCARVSVGWVLRGETRVVALSHAVDFDARAPLLEKLGAAMDEALEQAATVCLPASAPGSLVTLAHGELLDASGGSACTVPLCHAGRLLGALTLERHEPFSPEEVRFCEALAGLLAPVLELKRQGSRSVREHVREAAGGWMRGLARPGQARAKLAFTALVLILLAAGFYPLPYHVGSPARLEGSIQRVVAAPIDGFLEQVNVRPGDTVAAGQVLAELALRDLEVERTKRQSELAQHENVYRAALARADRTQLVIHQAKAAEAAAQLALLESQMQRARIRAPFDGVVLQGDLAPALGSPVQRGEVLLTLAPDDRFRLIVEVDERDIAEVRPGQRGRLALAALPGEVLDFTVARVLPVAVSGEGRNYFEVEGALGAGRTLRPGLRGVAKIAVGERSALWIATHRVVAWARLLFWSLGA